MFFRVLGVFFEKKNEKNLCNIFHGVNFVTENNRL